MTDLKKALRYPWRNEGWYGQILPLTLLQLIPIVGQIILAGYGLAVAQATYSQQTNLPKLHLSQAFVNGLRLVAVGIVYCFPVILMVLFAFSTSGATEAESSAGAIALIFPLIVILFGPLSSAVVKRRPALKSVFTLLSGIIGIVFVGFLIFSLRDLFLTMRGGLQFNALQLNATIMPMVFIALLLFAFIVVALLVSGVRFSVTGSGLLNPDATLKLMLANRSLTGRFIGSVWLLFVTTLIATMLGSVFLLMPGLLLFVAGSMSIWFLTTQYAIKIGVGY